MFRFSGFTQRANSAINAAMTEASVLGHTYVGSEHLLLGLLEGESNVAKNVLATKNIKFEDIKNLLIRTIGRGIQSSLTPDDFTPRCKRILEMSLVQARLLGHNYVGTEHILMAILKETDSYAVRFIREQSVEPDAVYKLLIDSIGAEIGEGYASNLAKKAAPKPNKAPQVKTPTVDKYSRDLTELARNKRLDPVIGRNKEIERVIQILSRRTKNNPCLIGEAGVGKTAIVEGLAQRIVDGEVPELLKEKRLVLLDLTGMVAGTKYRGEFEERIKTALEEVISAGNIILFIDEIHTIMGIGAAEGAVDAANILKPQLARGELQLIGATTIDEYRKNIEKDAALERRFQSVLIEQPDEKHTILILKGLRDKYEAHHKIKISDEALEAAVTLSSRYISDRQLPDKAIDLIDEAASRVRLKAYTAPEDLKELESKVKLLNEEKEAAINAQHFEQAASIRDKERKLKEQCEKLKSDWHCEGTRFHSAVSAQDVAQVVAQTTGIDITKLNGEQSDKLLHLEDTLHKRLIGQNEAVTAVSKAIRRSRVGIKDPNRPVGSFIFLGPTGVGKTELCKALAETLFGSEQSMIRLDMSEYMEKHTVSKLIGSPPGYVGYEEGGQLTEKIRRKPYSVILFDEIEKAHSDVFNMMLQILEDGRLTDSQGRVVSFKNAVVIMTSNIGARYITEHHALGFGSGVVDDQDAKTKGFILAELKKTFKPEFLNRVDDIIVFHKLARPEIELIVGNMLKSLKSRMQQIKVEVAFEDEVLQKIADEGYDPIYGARPLRRAVQSKIEDPLADAILHGKIQPNEIARFFVKDGQLQFETNKLKQAVVSNGKNLPASNLPSKTVLS